MSKQRTTDPRALADELEWRDGADSPTGRRVLDIRPASRTLLSASADPEAARNVVDTPKDVDALASGLPNEARYAAVDWSLDDAELQPIRDGFAPTAMEDKWRILSRVEDGTLRVYFRRSWTNDLVFVLEIVDGRATSVCYTKGAYRPELTARAVLDAYLLGRTCVIPAPRELGTDKQALMSYGISLAGRRCDFVEPEDVPPATAIHAPGPRALSWQVARPGIPVPAKRCYWVVESLLLAGAYPESPNAVERGQRVEDLWRAGIRTFVSLVEEDERSPSGAELARYAEAVAKLSARWGERATCVRLPIPDLSVTSADAMRTILDVIDLSLDACRPVYVHCLGGVGRTGTVVGCWLRRQGLATREEVLDLLARLRRADVERAGRPSPETHAQREMVLGWNG